MPNLRGSEWLLIILLLVLLFGAKRLPDAARSMGRSLRIFKAETKGLTEDSSTPEGAAHATPVTGTAAPVSATPAAIPPAPPVVPASPVLPASPIADPQVGGSLPKPPTQA